MSEAPPKSISINGETFYCSENGLRAAGRNRFDPNVEKYLPLATPKLTKKGTVAVRQPSVRTQSGDYWRAQCMFRGLSSKGTTKVLQERIRSALDKWMDPEIVAAEARIKEAYKVHKEERWKTLLPKVKMEEDPTRFLMEQFYETNGKVKDKEVVVVKDASRSTRQSLQSAAYILDLEAVSTDAPYKEDGTKPNPSRWIVIGKSRSAVVDKSRDIGREFSRREKKTGAQWDITGNWKIRCEELENYKGYLSAELSIDFYSSSSLDGREIWGIFNFGIITGIMRFMGQTAASKGSTSGNSKRKRAEADDEDDDDNDDDDSKDKNEDKDEENDAFWKEEDDDPAFLLPRSAAPSSRNPTWNYRWRGEETGTGEIQLRSDQHVLSITFEGPGGSRCKGIFRCDFIDGDIPFSGERVEEAQGDSGGSAYGEWCQRSEAAYERARVGRWRGGRIRRWR